MRAPSREAFDERFVRTGTPAVIEGAIDDWPAHARWTEDYLRAFAEYPVVLGDGTRTTFGGFLDALDRPAAYMSLDPFALPALLADLAAPRLIDREKIVRSIVWLGSTSRLGLHYDEADNLHCVVRGRKTFHLIAPEHYRNLYPVDARRSLAQGINWSEVDVFAPDLARFPRFAEVEVLRAQLGPGDVLYLPCHYWHAVEHEGRPTIAVNFWWPSERLLADAFFRDRALLTELKRRVGQE